MKFDFIIGNPPYLKDLHFKVSCKAIENLEDHAEFIFVQPATAYFNKTKSPDEIRQRYKDIIRAYETEAKIISTGIFPGAIFTSDLAVTKITKTINPSEKIKKITYKNGKVYRDVDLWDISFTQMPPWIYKSISDKILKYTSKVGNLDSMVSVKGGTGIKISSISGSFDSKRGKIKPSFYCFYSPPNYQDNYGTYKDGFIVQCSEDQAENIYDYLESRVALMAQSLKKYSVQIFGFKKIPLMDFSRTYTDEELFDMVGITEKEVRAINKAIPNYTARS